MNYADETLRELLAALPLWETLATEDRELKRLAESIDKWRREAA